MQKQLSQWETKTQMLHSQRQRCEQQIACDSMELGFPPTHARMHLSMSHTYTHESWLHAVMHRYFHMEHCPLSRWLELERALYKCEKDVYMNFFMAMYAYACENTNTLIST